MFASKISRFVKFAVWAPAAMALVIAAMPMFSSTASAADGNKLIFSYNSSTVYQNVSAPNNWATASTLTATVSAAEVQDWKASSDSLIIALNLYDSGGGGICSHSTAQTSLTDNGVFNDYSLTISSTGACSAAFSAAVGTIRLSLIGQDGEFWAGNYGTQIESASLKLDGVELLTNTEFNTNTGWTSTAGWQTCSADSGASPCIGISTVEAATTTTAAPTTTLPPTTTVPPTTTIPAAGAGFELTEQFEGPGPTTGVTASVNGNSLTTTNQNGWYYANMNGGYGTSGYAVYAGNPTASVVFTLPSSANPRSFYFRVGAKNGDATGIATYSDGTTQNFTVGNSVLTADCSTCQAPGYYREIYFNGNGKIITSFSLPAEGDIYFVDMLRYSNSTSVASVVDPNPAVTTTTTTTTTSTTTTTTTIAPYYNSVQNLTANANDDGSVSLDWDVPASSNLEPYMYDVSWFDLNNGTESGGWGVWTYAANTSYTVGSFQFPNTTGYGPVRFKIRAGNAACVGEGQGSCVYGTYATVDVAVLNPSLQTTTTTSTTTTSTTTTSTTTTTTTTTTTVPPTTVPPTTITGTTQAPTPETTVPETTVPETTVPETTVPETTVPATEPDSSTTSIPEEEDEETTPSTQPLPDDEVDQDQPEGGQPDDEELEEPETNPNPQPDESSESEQEEQTEQETDQTDPSEQSEELPQQTVPEEIIEEIATGTEYEISDAVSDLLAELDEEEIVAAVAEIIDALVDVEDVSQLTDEDKAKVAAVVAAVIESGISEEVAAELASSPAVLASIDTEQAEQVFEQVDAGSLTEEAAEAIVDAVQEATEEVREVFEDTVDLFQGAFDSYVMTGQTISVGQRRTVVAVNLVTASIAAAAAIAGGTSGPASPSGGSSPGGSSPSSANDAARKEDEEESEMNGELAGDELDWVKKISIYKTVNGVKKVDWKAFFKKFGFGIMNMGWTLSGAVVVYMTLSGSIQKVAGALSVLAFGAAMYLHMKEPSE